VTVQIYNTLTKRKEPFVPIDPKGERVNMYTCGVTVYDKCHIGHARSVYIFDVIRRYLVFRGYDVHFVRNITDIDDKIIKKAQELNVTAQEVAEKNIAEYYADLKRLGLDPVQHEPRATDPENISEMITFIEGLIIKGLAYEVDGDVYFCVRDFEEYGKLSGQSIEMMQEAVRIEKDEKKRDPLDFALWKKSKEAEPFWNSPWGRGRPGWHIECSCMSLKHLDCQTLDIHGGGMDLVFPHHENEIAQSEGFTGEPFAKYWIHHGLLTINRQKMSKSLSNFITIEAAVDRYGADQLKLFFLSSHYGSVIDFSEEKMADVEKQRQHFLNFLDRAMRAAAGAKAVSCKWVEDRAAEFLTAMDDDFNTAKAMGILFEFMNDVNKFIDQKKELDSFAGIVAGALSHITVFLKEIFNLELSVPTVQEVEPEVLAILEQRAQARKERNFAESDRLRDVLQQRGILVQDTKDGQSWRRL